VTYLDNWTTGYKPNRRECAVLTGSQADRRLCGGTVITQLP